MSLADDLDLLRASLGADWVDARIAECRSRRGADQSGGLRRRRLSHPLIEDWCDAVDAEGAGGEPLEAKRRLCVLAAAIRQLIDNSEPRGGAGFEERLTSLREDEDNYLSHVFEFSVAEAVGRGGHSVTFMQETTSTRRVYDLLVDDEVEVECKDTTGLRKPDRASREQWGLLFTRSAELAMRRGLHLQVDLTTAAKPTRQHTEWALTHLRAFAGSDEITVHHHDSHGDLSLGRMHVQASVAGFRVTPGIPAERGPHVWEHMSMTGQNASPGTLAPHDSCLVTCRTLDPANWTKRLRGALRDSVGKFTGERPALIIVAIPAYVDQCEPERIELAKALVSKFLAEHPEVSGISLVKPGRAVTPSGMRITQTWISAPNPAASQDLPDWAR